MTINLRLRHYKSLFFLFLLFFISTFFCIHSAHASDWRVGALMGYGGTGISGTHTVNNVPVVVQRSEGPGVLTITVDTLISESTLISIEHSRGFRLGPFSSGVSFTGLGARWYRGPAPSMSKPEGDTTMLFVKKYSFFAGVATGLAQGTIVRQNDQVDSVQGSGVYIGTKFGFDLPQTPSRLLRTELVYNTTFFSATTPPTTVSEFSLQFGMVWAL